MWISHCCPQRRRQRRACRSQRRSRRSQQTGPSSPFVPAVAPPALEGDPSSSLPPTTRTATMNPTTTIIAPLPLSIPKKRRRSSQPAAPAPKKAKVATTKAPVSSSTGSSTKPKVPRKQRLPPAPRNVQVGWHQSFGTFGHDELEMSGLQMGTGRIIESPILFGHLLTHQQPDKNDQSKGYWCKGLKLVDREAYNKMAIRDGRETIPEDAGEIVYLFEQRVGGCMRNFSRRDALKRHIDNPNNSCCGHALEPFQEFDCKYFLLLEVWGRF